MPSIPFFLQITEILNLHQEEKGDVISLLKNAFPRKFPGRPFQPPKLR
jgi:hypothetical protein